MRAFWPTRWLGLEFSAKPPLRQANRPFGISEEADGLLTRAKLRGKQYASPRLCLGRFASLFIKRRIRAAYGRAEEMPPPSIRMTRPERSRDPGPSIPAAPGRCPLHQGQLGWNMQLPCEACIALAFSSDQCNNCPEEGPGISQAFYELQYGCMYEDHHLPLFNHLKKGNWLIDY